MWQEAAKPVGYGIAGYLALLLLIQGLAWPMAMEEMSDYCPENSANCVYSSQTKSYRTELPSLRFNASIDSVMNAVIQWEESLWFSSIQSSDQSFIHIVHRTPLMQFPDDVFITLTCTNGMVEVSFQSQSRLGAGDRTKTQNALLIFMNICLTQVSKTLAYENFEKLPRVLIITHMHQ